MNVFTVNPGLPKKAGKTKVEFYEPRALDAVPMREGADIRLPLHKEAQFVPLLGGRQFLYKTYVRDRTWNRTDNAVFFGGTDEEPFLVRLDPRVLDAAKGTIDGFFKALVPEVVEKGTRVFGKPAKRQGDIFALPTDLSWKTVKTLLALQQDSTPDEVEFQEEDLDDEDPEETGDAGMSVFQTRHRLHGMRVSLNVPGLGDVVLAEGELKAPDHADLKLPRIHILRQAAFLFDPRNAD